MSFEEFLAGWLAAESAATEDVLASFLPLMREVIEAHQAGRVAPLEGLAALQVERARLWFEEAARQAPRQNRGELARLEPSRRAVEVMVEARRTLDVDEGEERLERADIGRRGAPITRPVYLPGYVTWEHEIGHHDPLTDILSLGLLLASLACRLDLREPEDLEAFVVHRRNLFALSPDLHPVLAQAIGRMTELDRERRAQDLPALLAGLESYREQTVALEVDLARLPGFRSRDARTRREALLARLRDRLFDLSRRNPLLSFRPTMQSLNLTQASVPLTLHIENVREDQILTWTDRLHDQMAAGTPLSLNKHLNFNEALYLPSLLERILADSRRDQREIGFAQLRLVACFLTWANLKEKPAERYVTPLVLLPVRLAKSKGIRDTWLLEPLAGEAEINPVLRHLFRQLYGIELPELIDLASTRLDALYELLAAKIAASEPAVTLTRLDRPRIELVHERARRRLDQYRQSARVSGRGVRHFGDLDYSYDPANYHPLGLKLFAAKVRTPASRLREIVEGPRPRSYAAPPGERNDPPTPGERTVTRSFFNLSEAAEENPYLWNFDLCNVTLANFRYRRMSLVRDYETLLERGTTNPAFEAIFSLAPRPAPAAVPALPLDQRFDVVACDPTQATAIAAARGGAHTLIQGPPGTGKSQTITNLIADFVARGERVLFVCEKRAALDVVFARLSQCGLGSLCCLVHDSQADKKELVLDLKETYERMLAEGAAGAPADRARERAAAALERGLAPLAEFAAAMARPLSGADLAGTELSVRRFLDRALELADRQPELSPEELERLPGYADWFANADRLAGLELSIADLEPSGIFARHPLRRLAPALAAEERPIERAVAAARKALAELDALEAALAVAALPTETWSSLGRVRQLLAYLERAAPLATGGNLRLVERGSPQAREFAAATARLAKAEKLLGEARSAAAGWRRKLPPADLATALSQARRFEGKLLAWLSRDWWRLRRVLRESYDFGAHALAPSWTQVLTTLEKEYETQAAVEAETAELQEAFGIAGDLAAFREAVGTLASELPRLPEVLRRLHAGLATDNDADEVGERVERALEAAEPAARLGDVLASLLVEEEGDDPPLADLRAELLGIAREARQIPGFLRVLTELASLPPGLGAALRRLPLDFRQIEAALAARSWGDLRSGDRALDRFDGRARRRHARELEAAHGDWLAANAAEIRRRVRERFLDHVRRSSLPTAELGRPEREWKKRYAQGRRILEHEFGKSMRYRAIRELVDGDSALVIEDLKPIWLMSPLSVSDTLRLGDGDLAVVDAVIFDEASQVPLEEAVPALFRGRQVIVVGDEMQLPPTDFFTARAPAEEDAEPGLGEDGSERVTFDLDSDSFLNHAAKALPSTLLGWHYRSRSESLISFSNQVFYDGRLLTVPDRASPGWSGEAARTARCDGETGAAGIDEGIELLLGRPLSFHRLAHGLYERRRNRPEAEYIARLVRDLLQRRLGLSLGVIAFSEAQQGEIEAALERLAGEDDEFRALYEEEREREKDGQFVGLLVRNLENVQGDERDVVILSICYGAGPDGRMLMNFGPINRSGGEKRLNVAFSRAKERMAIVSSIDAAAITNDYNRGAACLKGFLAYTAAVSRGDLPAARRALPAGSRWQAGSPAEASAAATDAVCRQLAAALGERGYRVDLGVGQSHFRVDLAVRREGDAEYRLGILVDAAPHYESTETLEREMLRPRLLRDFGWHLAHILGKDWHTDREGELARILALLEGEEGTAEPLEPEPPAAPEAEPIEIQEAEPVEIQEAEPDEALEPEPEPLPPGGEPFASPPALAAALPAGEGRRFEYRDDRSAKFWQIAVAGAAHTVRFGRLGTAGQSQTKAFPDEAAARQDAERLIREKLRKGYREIPARA